MIYLLWSGVLFSTAIRAVVVVAELVVSGVLFLTSFILALRLALVHKLVTSGILFSVSISLLLTLFTSFLTASFLLRYIVYLNPLE